MKKNLEQIRKDIKELATLQTATKQNRKTVHFNGKRIMPPHEAQCSVVLNKEQLRCLYLAYAILRGVPLGIVDKNYQDTNMYRVNKLVEHYGNAVCVGEE